MGHKHIGVTTLSFQGHITSSVTWPNRFAMCHFILVSHWNRASIFSRFWDVQPPKPVRAHTQTHTHTHRHMLQVILYSVRCNVLHQTDNNIVCVWCTHRPGHKLVNVWEHWQTSLCTTIIVINIGHVGHIGHSLVIMWPSNIIVVAAVFFLLQTHQTSDTLHIVVAVNTHTITRVLVHLDTSV